jgi:RNA polymerase sigma factor (sigma-70 family)
MNSPFPPPGGHATTDASLVAAHLAGDRTALAAIYDRHASALYDTASAMLRDRHEAADVLQDVFLVAAERLDQLREPDRLKAWLFAVLRNEVFRRTKRRSRQRPVDFSAPGAVEMAAPDDPGAGGAAVMAADLGALLREAARGLDERDQLVLELTARRPRRDDRTELRPRPPDARAGRAESRSAHGRSDGTT